MGTRSLERELVADTQQGKVRGVVSDGVAVFRGIPFAAPPLGPHRFSAPQPVTSWHGVRDAREYGATAPAASYHESIRKLLGEVHIAGDDYLNLNVWTPDAGTSGLPVLVWIHGGAFTNGSGAQPTFAGQGFARGGVVTVTINYRLGVEGYTLLEGAPANRGLLDQVAALQWVQQSIAAFGGDPDNVTVAGQSAGAMSVCALMAMPAARGLFRRAIAQSGAGSTALAAEDAQTIARVLSGRLGCEPTASAFAELPLDRVLAAQQQIVNELRFRPNPAVFGPRAEHMHLGFCPVVDGESLPARPIDAIGQGAGADVDLLIGTTADEYRLYLVPPGWLDLIGNDLVEATRSRFRLPADAARVYAEAEGHKTPGEILSAMVTDYGFRLPACRVMEARSAAPARTFAYRFGWRSPVMEGRLASCHSVDVPFAFDNLAVAERLVGTAAPQELATAMHTAWTRFVCTGDPGWPAWNPDSRPTMQLDHPALGVADDPAGTTRRLWDGWPF